ncbi:MAG TPA: hypothetical protein VJV79_21170 [Polyangiaceae bacterium]|nr:hypothetical protein [Polyangiaceae bacterium]
MARLDDGTWLALSLRRGDYRLPTEERGPPPLLAAGAELELPSAGKPSASARATWSYSAATNAIHTRISAAKSPSATP